MQLSLKNIGALLLMLVSSFAFAQETTIYYESNELFKEAMFLIEQEKYLAAQEVFEQLEENHKSATDNDAYVIGLTSSYYSAYCSYKLDLPDTEKRYVQFIRDYHDNHYRAKAYFDLGSYYFANKKTALAIKYYELIDPKSLTREELMTYKFNLGYAYFKRKKFMEAKPLFREVKNGTNKYTESATYYYGFISFYDEDYAEAEKSFEALKTSKLYEDAIPYYLSQIYYMRGNYQLVVDYAAPLLEKKGIDNKKEISHIVGQAYFELGDYTKAEPLLSDYIESVRKVTKEEVYQLAYAQYKNQSYNKAIDNLLSLNVVDGAMGQNAMYVLADSYLKTNQKAKAKDAFQKAASTEFDPVITENSLFEFAKLSYELDFIKNATDALTDFLEKYPNSQYRSEAAQLLSQVLLTTKDYGRAIEIMETYNVSGPEASKTYQMVTLFRAIELYNDRIYPESLGLIDKSLANPVDPDIHAQALFLKGNLMYEIEKYEAAIINFNRYKQLNTQSSTAVTWASNSLADYYAAYGYFKQKQYSDAATYFAQGINNLSGSSAPNDVRILKDSYLRSADCNFMIKNYPLALNNYDKVINGKWQGADYALLQKSIIYGLQGNISQKINTLQSLSNGYPSSAYAVQAAFELGNAYLENDNLSAAASQFNSFTKKYKDSALMPDAYLRLGLIYLKQENNNKSLASYKKVVIDYPNSSQATEALAALKEIYISMGRPNDYIAFVESQSGISISVSAQDSLLFQVAEDAYITGNCNQALASLDEYLTTFPQGYFQLKAHYYRADCLFKANSFSKAYVDYKKVIEKGVSDYYENSLVKATYIAYEVLKNYQEANFLYNELYQSAALQSNKEIAVIGLMRTYYKLDRQTDVLVYANKVLQDNQINEQVKTEATFYKAKALFATNKYNDAAIYFGQIVNNESISSIKAESAYHLALIKHLNKQYQQSLDDCFAVKNEYASYEYWVVKTFILIADNYTELDNIFQAKATLQSILNNYNGDQALIDEAQAKLDALEALEMEKSKLDLNIQEQDTIQFDD